MDRACMLNKFTNLQQVQILNFNSEAQCLIKLLNVSNERHALHETTDLNKFHNNTYSHFKNQSLATTREYRKYKHEPSASYLHSTNGLKCLTDFVYIGDSTTEV